MKATKSGVSRAGGPSIPCEVANFADVDESGAPGGGGGMPSMASSSQPKARDRNQEMVNDIVRVWWVCHGMPTFFQDRVTVRDVRRMLRAGWGRQSAAAHAPDGSRGVGAAQDVVIHPNHAGVPRVNPTPHHAPLPRSTPREATDGGIPRGLHA